MKILKNFTPNILVIGDLMIDHYLWGSCERISPEAPVQIVDIKNETTVLGGAGNVVNNLVTLGAKVFVSSVIGKDDNGSELIAMLKSIDVDTTKILQHEGRKTSKKSRVIASSQQVLRYDKESKDSISKCDAHEILNSLSDSICGYDAVILSDYGKGVLSDELCEGVLRLCKKTV